MTASNLLEKVTGDSIRNVSVEGFLKEWIDGKATKAAGTVERYQNTIRLFRLSAIERLPSVLSQVP
jgi:hypothetical protein